MTFKIICANCIKANMKIWSLSTWKAGLSLSRVSLFPRACICVLWLLRNSHYGRFNKDHRELCEEFRESTSILSLNAFELSGILCDLHLDNMGERYTVHLLFLYFYFLFGRSVFPSFSAIPTPTVFVFGKVTIFLMNLFITEIIDKDAFNCEFSVTNTK